MKVSPALLRVGSGAIVAQGSFARGHRVWNRQPEGGSIGLGISPAIGCRERSVTFRSGAASIRRRV